DGDLVVHALKIGGGIENAGMSKIGVCQQTPFFQRFDDRPTMRVPLFHEPFSASHRDRLGDSRSYCHSDLRTRLAEEERTMRGISDRVARDRPSQRLAGDESI